MTKYLDPGYTFDRQTSYSREEIDRSLNRKANVANVYNRKEIQERTDVLSSSIQGVNNQIRQLKLDISEGNVNTVPLGTVIDGDLVDLFLKRESLPFQRPEPANLNTGELSVGTNDLSPFLYLKDSTGVVRRISGVQFGTAFPNGTAYDSGNSNTYKEQRTRGELFYHTSLQNLSIWTGTSWLSLTDGVDGINTSNLKTKIESQVKLEDLNDVVNNSLKLNDFVLTWDGTNYQAKVQKVTSVNTQTGNVTLTTDNISDTASTTKKYLSAAEKSKLASVEPNATADQTATEIRDLLQSLTGTGRLNASAISNLPSSQVNGVNGLTGNVTITTDDINDSSTRSYVQTIINSPNQVIIGNSLGQPISLTPSGVASSLSFDGTSVLWRKSNISSVERLIGSGTHVITKEFTFCNPASGNIILNFNPSISTGEKYFIKNFGINGTVTLPGLANLVLSPGQQLLVFWDGVQWQTI